MAKRPLFIPIVTAIAAALCPLWLVKSDRLLDEPLLFPPGHIPKHPFIL